MHLTEFAFYLGVYDTDPTELLNYKIGNPAVIDLLGKASAVVDTIYGGDIRKFLLALEDELKEQLFVDDDTLGKIKSWLNGITTMRLD